MIRLKKIRDSARGQDCMVELPGCSPGPGNETVVFAHYNEPGHGMMGGKSDDCSGAYACNSCHDALDGRVNWPININQMMSCREHYENNKEWFWFRAMRRTWKLLIENGVLK